MEDLWKTFWEIPVSYKAHLLSNEKECKIFGVKSHSPMSQLHISDFKEKHVENSTFPSNRLMLHVKGTYNRSKVMFHIFAIIHSLKRIFSLISA